MGKNLDDPKKFGCNMATRKIDTLEKAQKMIARLAHELDRLKERVAQCEACTTALKRKKGV